MSEKFRLYRKVGFQIAFYTKCLNVIIDSIGPSIILRSICLKVNVASRKNSNPTRVSKRSLTYYKTGSKAFFMLRFSAARLSNVFYEIKCPF